MKSTDSGKPLVSVIMPTYCHSKFIGAAMESILNQTYKNLEIIVIDNYSEDNTEEIVASYKDDRIRYLKYRNNGIIASSRNHGIKNAQGKYIAFLDSDDLWLPEKLERQITFFSNNPDVGLVYSNVECFGNTVYAGRKQLNREMAKSGYVLKDLIFRNFIPTLTVLCRKECLLGVGCFNERKDLCTAEDYELWIRLASIYKISYLDLVLAKYRIHADNSSHKGNHAELRKLVFLHCIKNNPMILDQVGRKAINKHIRYLTALSGIVLWEKGKNGDARKEFVKALDINNGISISNIALYLLYFLSLFDYKLFGWIKRLYLLLAARAWH